MKWRKKKVVPEGVGGLSLKMASLSTQLSTTHNTTPHHTPGHSTIVQSNLPLKLDPQSGLQVVLVLHIHDSSVWVLKQVVPAHRNLQYPREIILKGEGQKHTINGGSASPHVHVHCTKTKCENVCTLHVCSANPRSCYFVSATCNHYINYCGL